MVLTASGTTSPSTGPDAVRRIRLCTKSCGTTDGALRPGLRAQPTKRPG